MEAHPTSAAFIDAARAGARGDAAWAVDFPRLESLAAGDRGRAALLDLGSVLATPRAESGAGAPVAALTLTVASPESFAAAAAMVRRHGSGLRALRLHADASGTAAARQQPEEKAAGDSPAEDAVASILAALLAAKQVDPSSAPLEELEVVNVDSSLHTAHFAGEALLSAVAALVAGPTAALRALSVRHLNCQRCTEASVASLVAVIAAAGATLESLDLRGSGHVLLEMVRSGAVRRLAALRHLDVGDCPLGDVWAPRLLTDLEAGVGGWFALASLRASHAGLTAHGLECMLGQLRRKDEAAEVATVCLDLSANSLGDDAAAVLATCLVRCHALKALDLRHNSFTPKSAAFLISSLAHASGLRSLCLRSNRLGNDGLAHLAAYSRHWPALETLDLTRCRITAAGGGLRSLAAALDGLESLQRLLLSGNNLRLEAGDEGHGPGHGREGSDGAPKLFAYDPAYLKGGGDGKVPTSFELDRLDREAGRVRYRGPAVEVGAGAEDKGPADPFQRLGDALSGCRGLRVLDLSDCCLSDANLAALAGRAAPPRLTELRLSANPLLGETVAVTALVRLLWCCTGSLQVLDLGFTALGDWGLAWLCDGPVEGDGVLQGGVLPRLAALETLQLSHAGVGAVGLEALTAAVASLSALQALSLEGNTARDGEADDGADRCVGLLGSLADSRRLRFLSLGGCLSDAARRGVSRSPELRHLSGHGVQVLL